MDRRSKEGSTTDRTGKVLLKIGMSEELFWKPRVIMACSANDYNIMLKLTAIIKT
jgi:hypothetical protein